MKNKTRCFPLFSPEDKDLSARIWFRDPRGYARKSFRIDGKNIEEYAHQIVFSRIFSLKSGEVIDHINRNRMDNRRDNLRPASMSMNARNNSYREKEFCGTTRVGKKWQAQVTTTTNGKTKSYYGGLYSDRKEAADWSNKKREELGFEPLVFSNHYQNA